ncbi:CARDB domain-containing protein, partial [cf. Phormidesmis sp. LEGE 11477]|uniref:CARDB domain-containing protein n=1 Tax=cf. Phormidesmis sp. LEGE 11477 TaxID=1828680 RepID=UPI001881E0EA
VLDESVSQSEAEVLADLEAIDRMLLGSTDIEQALSEVQQFAQQHRFNPGIDPLTGSAFANQTYSAAQSLAQVVEYVQTSGLPDLTATVGELTLSETALPGESGRLEITLNNQGNLGTQHPVTLKVFAQPQGESDSAVEIGEKGFGSLKLEPGKSKTVSAAVELPDDFAPGEYNILVALDTANNVPEADETNNVVVAAFTQTVAWQFGNVDGSSRELSLSNADGATVRFRLKGDGYGEVTEQGGVKHLALYGTTDESEVSIQADGSGNVIGDVTVNGDLKQFYGTKTDLQGDLVITGSVDRIVLDDVSDAQILIGPGEDSEHVADIKLDQVSNLSVISQSQIGGLSATSWTTTDGATSLIKAPELKTLNVGYDFDADIEIAGELERVKVKGASSGIWKLGQVDKLDLDSTTADWSLAVTGELNKLDVKHDLFGTVSASDIRRVFVRGDMANAKVLVGSDLGPDGQVGGGDDAYGGGELKELIVYGDILSSIVGAGLDPTDASYVNGNEQLVPAGVIGKVDVRGTVSDDSLLAAEQFTKQVKIERQTIDPELDSRFL